MRTVSVDTEPGQLLRWLLEEECSDRHQLTVSATRACLAESEGAAAGYEDLDEVVAVGELDIAPMEHGGWRISLRAEDRLGQRVPDDEGSPEAEEEIDLAAFDEAFIRTGRASVEITATAEDADSGRRLARILRAIEMDAMSGHSAAKGARAEVERRLRLQAALLDPTSVFAEPSEVLTDPELSEAMRLEILRRWEYDARTCSVADDEGMPGADGDTLHAVLEARWRPRPRGISRLRPVKGLHTDISLAVQRSASAR